MRSLQDVHRASPGPSLSLKVESGLLHDPQHSTSTCETWLISPINTLALEREPALSEGELGSSDPLLTKLQPLLSRSRSQHWAWVSLPLRPGCTSKTERQLSAPSLVCVCAHDKCACVCAGMCDRVCVCMCTQYVCARWLCAGVFACTMQAPAPTSSPMGVTLSA